MDAASMDLAGRSNEQIHIFLVSKRAARHRGPGYQLSCRPAQSSVAGAARAFYSNLHRPHNLVDHVDTKRISAMWKAMQWRQTSKRSDETMAIARILNVDPTELVYCNDEERMMVLLQCLPEIPPAFIFLPGKRLTTKGFRLAPATWMGGWEIDFPDPLGLPSKPMLFPRGYDIVLTSYTHRVPWPKMD